MSKVFLGFFAFKMSKHSIKRFRIMSNFSSTSAFSETSNDTATSDLEREVDKMRGIF